MKRHNWENLADELEPYAPIKSEYEAARILGLSRGTVRNAILRGDLPPSLFGKEDEDEPDLGEIGKLSIKESGNEATIKYNAAEPLDANEVLEIAGVDKSQWRIVDKDITLWQMGRKAKRVSLEWVAGKATGFVEDSGKIAKTYLYRINVKLTRINRVAVKPVLRPINISVLTSAKSVDYSEDGLRVLFIADPHFGFRQTWQNLTTIHSRTFINGLLTIARAIRPNVTVWNGDLLDLAEFSRFDSEPELLHSTQLAGIELGWVLAQFKSFSNRQVILEGNHEVRLQKALVKNLSAGYQLKPIHDLEGWPLLSVPRFLGLDELETEWIGNYPSGYLKIGTAKFQHGSIVRAGSGKTISALMSEVTGDRFFGHIHRAELAQKYVEDAERSVWVGSPGCACDKANTPGSDDSHNWQLGAFLIHFSQESGHVQNVEHITAASTESPIWFRGQKFVAKSYLGEMLDSLPGEYADRLAIS